jgi:hypothetical protein
MNRLRTEGISTVLRYAVYRIRNAWLLRRSGVGPAMADVAFDVSRQDLGFEHSPCNLHTPTPSVQLLGFRTTIQRFVGPDRATSSSTMDRAWAGRC